MKNIIMALTCLVALVTMSFYCFAGEPEPCLKELVTDLKDLKVTEARKVSEDCSTSVPSDTIKGLITYVELQAKACDELVAKGDKATEKDLYDMKAYCGSESRGNFKLTDADKYSGVTVSDLSKKYDKFMADAQAAVNKKDADKQSALDQREKADIAHASSAEAMSERACDDYYTVSHAKKAIAEEKEIEKESGVIDKARLHEAGSVIVSYNKDLEDSKKKYKAKSGKEWSLSMCPH